MNQHFGKKSKIFLLVISTLSVPIPLEEDQLWKVTTQLCITRATQSVAYPLA